MFINIADFAQATQQVLWNCFKTYKNAENQLRSYYIHYEKLKGNKSRNGLHMVIGTNNIMCTSIWQV